jgi:subtilisin family serine protease
MHLSGFTIVFRLAIRGRSTATAVSSAANGLGRRLIVGNAAEQVFGGRASMAVGSAKSRLYVTAGGDMQSTSVLLERLQADPDVELAYVAPPRYVLASRTAQAGGGKSFIDGWYAQIRLSEARSLKQWGGTNPVSIGIADSGLDGAHPQLAHMGCVEYLPGTPAHPDAMGHGSHVAGLIRGNPNSGNSFEGIAPASATLEMRCGLAPVSNTAAYYRALEAAKDARLVNLSLGGTDEDPFETEAIQEAVATGSVIIVAMGNDGENGSPRYYPASLPGVVAVGAVDATGQRADFSNEGDWIAIAAPGVDIVSTVPTYSVPEVHPFGRPPLASMSGTSMATPIVTGIVARMLAYDPKLTSADILALLRGSLGGSWNAEVGRGVIDAYETLKQL